jgi:uncharacterized phage protein
MTPERRKPAVMVMWTCPTCHGAGHIYRRHSAPICPTCKGAGEFFQYRPKLDNREQERSR